MNETKRCYKCGETKLVSEFYENRTQYDGLQSHCKPCGNAIAYPYVLKYNKKNADLARGLRVDEKVWLGIEASDTFRERFWSHVDVTLDDAGCWEWTGGKQPSGYGNFNVLTGVSVLAHRVSWVLAHPGEELDSKTHVHHSCRTPACVRPEHLVAMTGEEHTEYHRVSKAAEIAEAS